MLESIKGLNVVEKKGVPFLQFEIFKNQPVIHGFSTRLGGVSRGEWSSMNISFTRGDNEADVKENHERLAAAVGYRTEDLVLTQQVHKTDILRVRKEDTGDVYRYPNRRIREIDGLVTDEPGVMLMTFFADCVPLIFYDPIKKAVGNAHSGWRGTVGAMGQKMVERMHEEFGSRPEDILAVIGPSICRNCYEVSDDVIAEFHKAFPWMTGFYEDKGNGHAMLDLWEANRQILLHAGCLEEHIQVSGLCTNCHPNLLFSHRYTGGKRGNLCAVIGLQEG